MFPSAAPRENIEILGKQNELFPEGPVIKCLMKVSLLDAHVVVKT